MKFDTLSAITSARQVGTPEYQFDFDGKIIQINHVVADCWFKVTVNSSSVIAQYRRPTSHTQRYVDFNVDWRRFTSYDFDFEMDEPAIAILPSSPLSEDLLDAARIARAIHKYLYMTLLFSLRCSYGFHDKRLLLPVPDDATSDVQQIIAAIQGDADFYYEYYESFPEMTKSQRAAIVLSDPLNLQLGAPFPYWEALAFCCKTEPDWLMSGKKLWFTDRELLQRVIDGEIHFADMLESPQPTSVYLIQIKNTNLYKIGMSKDVKQRLRSLVSSCRQELEIVASKEFFGKNTAEEKEGQLHRQFSEKRHDDNSLPTSEWFNLNSEDVETVKEILK